MIIDLVPLVFNLSTSKQHPKLCMLWKIGPSIFNHKTGWHNKRTRTSTPRDPDLRTYNFEVFGVQGFINNANISFENRTALFPSLTTHFVLIVIRPPSSPWILTCCPQNCACRTCYRKYFHHNYFIRLVVLELKVLTYLGMRSNPRTNP